MKKNYNYIIQGAGASGLWLAYWMQKSGLLATSNLLIIEGDAHKSNDRTWCFWETNSGETMPFVNHNWQHITILGQKQSIAPYRYNHCRSIDFYHWIHSLLDTNANIHWLKGWADAPVVVAGGIEVTVNGDIYSGKWYFKSGDTAEKETKKTIHLWQSFVGWRVKIVSGAIDATCATLMDFSIPQNNKTRFLYVLPMSDREALIEVTQFDCEKLDKEKGQQLLTEICASRGWQTDVLELEYGAIPMSSAYDNKEPYWPLESRIIDIGVVAGALKPTTGYGFLRMMHHGKALAEALTLNTPMPKIYRKMRFRFYDRLLLNILVDYPWRGKSIFERLFARIKVTTVLKFLDEGTNFWEEMQIFCRLQVALFVKILFRYGGR